MRVHEEEFPISLTKLTYQSPPTLPLSFRAAKDRHLVGSDKLAFQRKACRSLCKLEARALAGLGEIGSQSNSYVTAL